MADNSRLTTTRLAGLVRSLRRLQESYWTLCREARQFWCGVGDSSCCASQILYEKLSDRRWFFEAQALALALVDCLRSVLASERVLLESATASRLKETFFALFYTRARLVVHVICVGQLTSY